MVTAQEEGFCGTQGTIQDGEQDQGIRETGLQDQDTNQQEEAISREKGKRTSVIINYVLLTYSLINQLYS